MAHFDLRLCVKDLTNGTICSLNHFTLSFWISALVKPRAYSKTTVFLRGGRSAMIMRWCVGREMRKESKEGFLLQTIWKEGHNYILYNYIPCHYRLFLNGQHELRLWSLVDNPLWLLQQTSSQACKGQKEKYKHSIRTEGKNRTFTQSLSDWFTQAHWTTLG